MKKSVLVSINKRQILGGGAKMFGNALQGIKKNDNVVRNSSSSASDVKDFMPMEKSNYVADSREILPHKPSEMWCASLSNIQNALSSTYDLPAHSSGFQEPKSCIEDEETPLIFPPIPLKEMMNESSELNIFSPSPSSSSGYLSSLEMPVDYADEQVHISPPMPKMTSPVEKLSFDLGNYLFLSSPLSDSAYVSATETTVDNEERDTSNGSPLGLKNVTYPSASETSAVNCGEFKPTYIKEASGYTFDWSSQKSSKGRKIQSSKMSSKSPKGFGLTIFPSVETLLSFNAESFIDSHCHLDLLLEKKKFQGNYADYLRENKQEFPQSYGGCVAVFCKPLLFKKYRVWTKLLTEENVWAAFGCHPKDASRYNDRIEKDLVDALSHLKVRALGEIGLDYSEKSMCPADKQKDVFRRQIKIALKKKLPLVIHCREAYDDCLTIMKEMLPENYPIHLHCFTDQWNIAEKYLSVFSSLCIGITNLVTFSSATEVHEVAQKIPLDRLLLETDAPFFVPTALSKDTSISDPGMAVFVAEKIASLKNISFREVLYQTRRNTKRIYDI